MTDLRCPVCQSDKVIRNCEFLGRASSARVELEVGKETPGPSEAWWDTKMQRAVVKRCHVCAACGFVMFTVEDPQSFWQACQGAPGVPTGHT